MREEDSEKLYKPVELLEIESDKCAYEVQEKLDIYNIPIQVTNREIEKLFNDVLEVELEEASEETEVTRGGIYVRRDGAGKYYSVKNICFHLTDLLELVFSLAQADKKRDKFFVALIFLIKLMKQLEADMNEEESAVCVALYRVTKRYAVTDDNIIKCITEELMENGYIELSEKTVGNVISELMEFGIVSVEEGRYEVTQMLLFE